MATPSNAVVVRTGIKAGALTGNHAQAVVVRTSVKAGGTQYQHVQAVVS